MYGLFQLLLALRVSTKWIDVSKFLYGRLPKPYGILPSNVDVSESFIEFMKLVEDHVQNILKMEASAHVLLVV